MKPRRRADLRAAALAVLVAAERWTEASERMQVQALSIELRASVKRLQQIRDQKPSEPPAASEEEEPTEPRRKAPK